MNSASAKEGEFLQVNLRPLADEGPKTAVYPYSHLREIQTATDCRNALLDETEPIEREFGPNTVQPLYDLVYTLNASKGMFTSHTVMAPIDQMPPYEWGKHYVAVAIILLSRNALEHFDAVSCSSAVDELGRMIARQAPKEEFTGWYLAVGPCRVVFTQDMEITSFRATLHNDTLGFGCQLMVGGVANSRRTAAQRWKAAIAFVNNALLKARADQMPAVPHRHALPGVLPSTPPVRSA